MRASRLGLSPFRSRSAQTVSVVMTTDPRSGSSGRAAVTVRQGQALHGQGGPVGQQGPKQGAGQFYRAFGEAVLSGWKASIVAAKSGGQTRNVSACGIRRTEYLGGPGVGMTPAGAETVAASLG